MTWPSGDRRIRMAHLPSKIPPAMNMENENTYRRIMLAIAIIDLALSAAQI
ncbi:hypothetical protein [Breoghania sp.]|uniref:hypothetical protein n=1 Tax=Breoghania sp. TaxID=2065378 RepID=UPI002AABA67E|nr:hypothetical protein [Breoghania sp.]